jgi:hypothetical protein
MQIQTQHERNYGDPHCDARNLAFKMGTMGLLAPIIEIQLKFFFSKINFRMKIQLHEQKYICTDKTHTIYWNLNHWSP